MNNSRGFSFLDLIFIVPLILIHETKITMIGKKKYAKFLEKEMKIS